jgi:hypothetical protein
VIFKMPTMRKPGNQEEPTHGPSCIPAFLRVSSTQFVLIPSPIAVIFKMPSMRKPGNQEEPTLAFSGIPHLSLPHYG